MQRVLVLLIAFVTLISSAAIAGDAACNGGSCGTRGGGDPLESSFYILARAIVSGLEKSKNSSFTPSTLAMGKVLNCLRVEISPEPSLDLDGRSVTAINIPDQCQIILSRPGWEKIPTKTDRVRLVIHELLGLARIEDHQYLNSQRLADEYFRGLQRSVIGAVNRFQIFTKSGIFKVPTDVGAVRVTVVGGGGGGGGGHLNLGSGGGGGGGGAVRAREVVVAGYDEIAYVVGRGGIGGTQGGVPGRSGTYSAFGDFLEAGGGGGGLAGRYAPEGANGGAGGGSGGGGGGNGVHKTCSGTGGVAGSAGNDGWRTRHGGIGGFGRGWDELEGFIQLSSYSPGAGGECLGSYLIYNGGGGGGGLVIGNNSPNGEQGTSTEGQYSGLGGGPGKGFGAGGGGGSGEHGAGGSGAPGVIYIEYFSVLD